jgi:hypothetical protein
MKRTSTSTSRPVTACLVLAATAAAFAGATSAQAASLHGSAAVTGNVSGTSISFATKVTMGHQALPLFRLTRTAPPTAIVSQALTKGGLQALAVEGGRLVGRDAKGVLHGYADTVTGDAEIFPDITPSRGPASREAAEAVAASLFASNAIIPKDATTIRIGNGTGVFGASASRGPAGSSIGTSGAQLLFTYVPAVRFADGLQVFGHGSQATIAVGTDGTVRGLVRRWEAASVAGSVAPTTTARQLAQSIAAQVGPFAKNARIIVNSVTPAYYDNNAAFLQPVYAFFATIHSLHGGKDDHVRGYVPFGKLAEPLPTLGGISSAAPASPLSGPAQQGGFQTSQITLGQYANDDGSMQDMANAYLNGFDSVTPGKYGPPIKRTQWYYATVCMYYSCANSYVNDVQIAYTSPHGDWWENTTDSNDKGFFYIDQIGTGGNPGYGSTKSGHMVTWIMDSCENVPSYYDLQYTTGNGNNAFNNWWQVFQGLHRVLGYRTMMLLGEDTMNYDIAQALAEGANAGSAYYNEVAAVSYPTYTDSHLNLTVHYDRVSIMNDERNGSESIYSVQGQSATSNMNNSWMSN